ncbi:MAG: hypothetical protein SGPRY_004703 [Prymnesium sp.]
MPGLGRRGGRRDVGNQLIDELRIAAAGEWGAERGGAGGCHYASYGDGGQARAAGGRGDAGARGGGKHRDAESGEQITTRL